MTTYEKSELIKTVKSHGAQPLIEEKNTSKKGINHYGARTLTDAIVVIDSSINDLAPGIGRDAAVEKSSQARKSLLSFALQGHAKQGNYGALQSLLDGIDPATGAQINIDRYVDGADKAYFQNLAAKGQRQIGAVRFLDDMAAAGLSGEEQFLEMSRYPDADLANEALSLFKSQQRSRARAQREAIRASRYTAWGSILEIGENAEVSDIPLDVDGKTRRELEEFMERDLQVDATGAQIADFTRKKGTRALYEINSLRISDPDTFQRLDLSSYFKDLSRKQIGQVMAMQQTEPDPYAAAQFKLRDRLALRAWKNVTGRDGQDELEATDFTDFRTRLDERIEEFGAIEKKQAGPADVEEIVKDMRDEGELVGPEDDSDISDQESTSENTIKTDLPTEEVFAIGDADTFPNDNIEASDQFVNFQTDGRISEIDQSQHNLAKIAANDYFLILYGRNPEGKEQENIVSNWAANIFEIIKQDYGNEKDIPKGEVFTIIDDLVESGIAPPLSTIVGYKIPTTQLERDLEKFYKETNFFGRFKDGFLFGLNGVMSAGNTSIALNYLQKESEGQARVHSLKIKLEKEEAKLRKYAKDSGESYSDNEYLLNSTRRKIAEAETFITEYRENFNNFIANGADYRDLAKQGRRNPVIVEMSKADDPDKLWELFALDPLGVAGQYVLENMVGTIASTAGSLATGSIAGGAAVSASLENSKVLLEQLEKYGADLKDPASIRNVMREHGDKIRKDARIQALVMGATSLITGAFGNAAIKKPLVEQALNAIPNSIVRKGVEETVSTSIGIITDPSVKSVVTDVKDLTLKSFK